MVVRPAECLACDVLEGHVEPPGGTILERGGWVLDHSVSPCLLRGWLILKPARHVEHLADLTVEESVSMGPLIQQAARALMTRLVAERVYVMSMGEVVRHVHLYLIPRYADMPKSGVEVMSTMTSGRWACGDQEAAEAAEQIRQEVRSSTPPRG